MDRAKDGRCAALKEAFAKARAGMSGPRVGIRYSTALRKMAVGAVDDGVDIGDVLGATGIAGTTLAAWLKRTKRAGKGKPGATSKAGKRRFRRLEVVGASAASAGSVSMVVGQGMRLEIPSELLTADLIRRMTEEPS